MIQVRNHFFLNCLLILEMAVTLQDLQGASKTIGKFYCICQLFLKNFNLKVDLHVGMLLEILMGLVMNLQLSCLHCIRKERSWFTFPAMTHPPLCLLKHHHPFKR